MIKVGLTGGYGTGKSTVTRMFGDLGARTINADDIVHELLTEDKGIIGKVAALLGNDVLRSDGTIDRNKTANIVFGNSSSLVSLTDILYPAVRQRISKWFDYSRDKNDCNVAIAEISMLIEGGALRMYDKIVLVLADDETQCRRCLENGISLEDFSRRTQRQMPLEEKARSADFIIDNSTSLEETRTQALEVWNKLGNQQTKKQ